MKQQALINGLTEIKKAILCVATCLIFASALVCSSGCMTSAAYAQEPEEAAKESTTEVVAEATGEAALSAALGEADTALFVDDGEGIEKASGLAESCNSDLATLYVFAGNEGVFRLVDENGNLVFGAQTLTEGASFVVQSLAPGYYQVEALSAENTWTLAGNGEIVVSGEEEQTITVFGSGTQGDSEEMTIGESEESENVQGLENAEDAVLTGELQGDDAEAEVAAPVEEAKLAPMPKMLTAASAKAPLGATAKKEYLTDSISWPAAKKEIDTILKKNIPYEFGGRSLEAWDCAGFVSYVMHTVYGTAWPGGEWGEAGTDAIVAFLSNVKSSVGDAPADYKAQLKSEAVMPGDIIIFYNSQGETVHTAIAGDNGTIYHAWSEYFGTCNTDFDYTWDIDGGHGKTFASYRVFRALASKGYIKVIKKSSDEKVSKGNSAYSLNGSTFKVYKNQDKSGGAVATLTLTGSDTVVTSGALDQGTYWVFETLSGKGYVRDLTGKQITVNPGKTVEVTFENSPVTGTIKVQKASAETAITSGNKEYSFASATFGVYKSYVNGEVSGKMGEITTDSSGKGSLSGLPLGTYYVKELAAPKGYVRVLEDVQKITLTCERTEAGYSYQAVAAKTLTFVQNVVKGKISVVKQSSVPEITEGNDCYSLNSAVFGVFSDKGCTNQVGEIVTNAEGKGSISGLPLGYYYVKELVAPKGFEVTEKEPVTVHLTAELRDSGRSWQQKEISALVFTDRPLMDPAYAQVSKEGEGGEKIPLAEYTFEYYKGSSVSGMPERTWVLRTDGNGVTGLRQALSSFTLDDASTHGYWVSGDELFFSEGNRICLPLGTLRVYESAAPEGYQLSGQIWTSTLMAQDGKLVWSGDHAFTESNPVIAEEAPIHVSVAIQKNAAGDTKTEGNKKAYSLAHAIYGVYADSDCKTLITTVETDEKGYAASELFGFAPQVFVKEQSSPAGFKLDQNVYEVLASQEQLDAHKDFVLELAVVEHELVADVTVAKKAKDADGNKTSRVLEGAEFTLYDGSGTVIQTKITGADGSASFSNLALGTYMVAETKAPEGFSLDPANRWSFEVTEAGCLAGEQFEFVAYDQPTVLKMDKKSVTRDGESQMMGTKWRIWATDKDGKTVFENAETTDEKGSFEIAEIPHGDGLVYHVQETWCSEAYNLDSETHEFMVDRNGFVNGESVYTVTAYNVKSDILFTKVDSETGAVIRDTLFALYKWEGEGEPVQGDDEGWMLVGQVLSDENGNGIFEGVKWGDYKLKELIANPAYKAPEESDLTTEFYLHIDASNPFPNLQVVENEPIILKVEVDKETISTTSAGLAYVGKDGKAKSNVGYETYPYEIGFRSTSNVRADEMWVTDLCQMVQSPYDLRITTLWLPITNGLDVDGKLWLLAKTNMTKEGTASARNFTQPELVPGSLCDGTMRFSADGWDYLGEYSACSGEEVNLADLLREGEFITGITLCFGAVDPGFATIEPLVYLVVATHELVEGTVIPNSVSSHISRNWRTVELGGEKTSTGLFDDDDDYVETRVIRTFETDTAGDLGEKEWGSSFPLPVTGGAGMQIPSSILAFAMLLSAGIVLAGRSKRKKA